ncbi:precorrin-3B synthase [Azospirillum canadense]|uniref:precorrin-3B synthase n=1 Tax=Azospirillum canadense TaxID=403962 RepID=UPI0022271099|nr:precorrin-3B synthase [Azospirillum canadense]MCW2243893.1 precorrin-3B synthase [Azospirillum canadense]
MTDPKQMRNAPRRRGTCPGVLAPMEVGDGLLVRVRVPAGVLPAEAAARIATLGRQFGNGLIDLSQRGNLQLRGVRADGMGALVDELRALGYVSADAESEAVRNVLASPTAGLDDTAVLDVHPYALALDARLAGDPALHPLPVKFNWLVDGGGRATLCDSTADVRFDAVATGDGLRFRVGLGGTLDDSAELGFCRPEELVEIAAAVALAFLELRTGLAEPPRRMAGLVKAVGVEAVCEAVAAAYPHPPASRVPPSPAGRERANLQLRGNAAEFAPPPSGGGLGWGQTSPNRDFLGPHPAWLGVAFPFGRLTCDQLEALAALATEVRLTPWRALLLVDANPTAAQTAQSLGCILDHADPRLKVTACSGVSGCDVGTTDTHADGLAIAARAAGLLERVRMVHVSGCAKGCAHPKAADVTLTARDGVYDAALNAAPGAVGWRSGLTPAEAVDAVAGLLVEELSRD